MALRVTTKEEQRILNLASPWIFALKIATSLSLIRRPKLIAIMHNTSLSLIRRPKLIAIMHNK